MFYLGSWESIAGNADWDAMVLEATSPGHRVVVVNSDIQVYVVGWLPVRRTTRNRDAHAYIAVMTSGRGQEKKRESKENTNRNGIEITKLQDKYGKASEGSRKGVYKGHWS